jgi:hypothetical protein
MNPANIDNDKLPVAPLFLGWVLRICLFVGLFVSLLGVGACNRGKSKTLSRRVTLWRKDKIPYGDYVAFESLKTVFPNAEITVNRDPPSGFSEGLGKKAYIVIVPNMQPDVSEMNAILNFVGQGNTVFISAFTFADSLLHTLNIRTANVFDMDTGDSLRLSVYNPATSDSQSFFYPGDAYDNYATSIDSQYTTILGRDRRGHPNFVKFGYKGGGALYLHFAPMAFTNFFLLYKGNKTYYDNVFSYLPVSVNEVKWDEYFRYDRGKDFSAFQYVLGNRSLKWAFWLLLLLFLLIYLFESKRRQRIIPAIGGLQNNSLEFVRTIGRLYYQRRDNQNLALKMVAHFQDFVRTRYNLAAPATEEGDHAFVERLSHKSGFAMDQLQTLIADTRRIRESSLSDEELLAFNRKLEEFYKQV